jgi:3-deoxy-D-manno-octulosonate 8-phosphate phosphatase KdsC-like HAD superfamily phosphatase
VQNAHPDVLGCVRYQTEAAGGRGAVREICDAFERAHQDSPGNGAVSPE